MLTNRTLQPGIARGCALLLSSLLMTTVTAQDIELRDPGDQLAAAWQKIGTATVPLRATWRHDNRPLHSYRRGVCLQGAEAGKCLLVTRGLTFRSDLASSMTGGFASSVSIWVGPEDGDPAVEANWKTIVPTADSMAAGMTFFLIEREDTASLPSLAADLPQEDQTVAILTGRSKDFAGPNPDSRPASLMRFDGPPFVITSAIVEPSTVGKGLSYAHGSYFSVQKPDDLSDLDALDFVFDLQGDLLGVGGGNMASMGMIPVSGTSSFLWVADVAESLKEHGADVSDQLLATGLKRRIEQLDKFGRPVISTAVTVTWSDDHKELQALSGMTGRWSNIAIPRQDIIVPIVGTAVAAVQLDEAVAAYSAETGTWDLLTIDNVDQAVVSVDSAAVKVDIKDSSRLYVFPLKSGVWTSPNDPAYREKEVLLTRAEVGTQVLPLKLRNTVNIQSDRMGVRIWGISHRVDAAVAALRQRAKSGVRSTPTERSAGFAGLAGGPRLPGPDVALAMRLRGASDKVSAADRQQLKSVVESMLQERLDAQKQMATELAAKLAEIEQALQRREANRDLIVSRRVDELLNPEIDWESGLGGDRSQPTKKTRPAANPTLPLRRPGLGQPGLGQPGLGQLEPGQPGLGVRGPATLTAPAAGTSTSSPPTAGSNPVATTPPQTPAVVSTGQATLDRLMAARAATVKARDNAKGTIEGLRARIPGFMNQQAVDVSIRTAQEGLSNAMLRWEHAWNVAQAENKQLALALQKAEAELKIAEVRLKEARRPGSRNRLEQMNLEREAELDVTVAQVAVESARVNLNVMGDLDMKKLNPANLNVEQWLKPVELKAAEESSSAPQPRQGRR